MSPLTDLDLQDQFAKPQSEGFALLKRQSPCTQRSSVAINMWNKIDWKNNIIKKENGKCTNVSSRRSQFWQPKASHKLNYDSWPQTGQGFHHFNKNRVEIILDSKDKFSLFASILWIATLEKSLSWKVPSTSSHRHPNPDLMPTLTLESSLNIV